VQANSKDKDLGIATATMTFFKSIGQAFGVAVGGTVFQSQFDKFVQAAIEVGSICCSGGRGGRCLLTYWHVSWGSGERL
jgi:hypothetical protein